jgi:hypothetical protein
VWERLGFALLLCVSYVARIVSFAFSLGQLSRGDIGPIELIELIKLVGSSSLSSFSAHDLDIE